MKKLLSNGFAIIGLCLCAATTFGKAPEHTAWTMLLKKHVSSVGKVDYKGFIKDSVALDSYLSTLSSSVADENKWSENEQKAFWINAYNAYTIKLVLIHFPLKSIKDIGSIIKVTGGAVSPWEIKFIPNNKEKLDLSTVENIKLRAKFNDPRIHFALVCASKSCPALLNEAYEASTLEKQLDARTKGFLTDPSKNKIKGNAPELSKIFEWYASDFTKKGSLTDFINTYSSEKIPSGAKISYLNYDWNLNN